MNTVSPPRLHVLLARDAPVGLVIRRGPTRQFATFLWDRKRDTFQLGQWAKGRIYEERCDLSPDGKYFIYFLLNGKWNSETKGSWTAISRAPYLHAITLYPQGDTWRGGGLWTGNHTYWLHGVDDKHSLRCSSETRFDPDFEIPKVYPYFFRLERDGWTNQGGLEHGSPRFPYIFSKSLGKGWDLYFTLYGKVYELIHDENCLVIPCPDWQWADLDGDRLVYAERGKLYSALLDHEGLTDINELYDFNPLQFEAIPAPY